MAADIKDEKTARPKPSRRIRSDAKAREGSVGSALRQSYQQTVSETIPPDLLGLLDKLA